MRRSIIVLTLVMGLVMAPTTAFADPDGGQRLRGMAGRTFEVHVTGTVEGNPVSFSNCYTFNADGSWDDPLFPAPGAAVPGVWWQHSVGARTSYTAMAGVPIGPVWTLVIVQQGEVTPAHGSGTLQLEAHNDLFVEIDGEEDVFPLGELTSIGYENPDCTL